jgi:transposase
MAHFKQSERAQGLFLTVNLEDQLIPGTFEWTIGYHIDEFDMSLFEQNYRNGETGAAAYPPRALLKLIFFCYSKGIISSREIERASKENITAKALADNNEPDHATVAAFISRNGEAVKDLFAQALMQ